MNRETPYYRQEPCECIHTNNVFLESSSYGLYFSADGRHVATVGGRRDDLSMRSLELVLGQYL